MEDLTDLLDAMKKHLDPDGRGLFDGDSNLPAPSTGHGGSLKVTCKWPSHLPDLNPWEVLEPCVLV